MIISNILYRMCLGFYFNETVGFRQHFFHNPFQQWILKMHFTKVPRYTAVFSHLKMRSLTCLSVNKKKKRKTEKIEYLVFIMFSKWFQLLQFHGITEQFGSEGTLKVIQFKAPCHRQHTFHQTRFLGQYPWTQKSQCKQKTVGFFFSLQVPFMSCK